MKLLEPEFEHKDDRRLLQQLFTADVKQVNYYRAKRGAVLGKHFHKETVEYFLITKGTIIYNESKVLNKGECFVVYPEEEHTLDCITDVDLVSFLSKPYSEEEKDIWKKES